MEKKDRSASLNTQQKAKKWLPFGSQKKYSGLGRCISLVKDDLSIGRIAAGISPGTTIFSYPPAWCFYYNSAFAHPFVLAQNSYVRFWHLADAK